MSSVSFGHDDAWEDEMRGNTPREPNWVLHLMALIAALSKLVLVSGDEILAKHAPHDQMWQVLAADRWYWLAERYDHMTLVHLPVYSLWIALVHLTGIPLRVAIEVTYLAAGYLLIDSLVRVGMSRRLAGVAYVLVAFNPISFEIFNHTLAETLYTPLLLAAVALTVNSLISTRARNARLYALGSGVFYAFLWNTRKESPLLLGILGIVAVLVAVRSLRAGRRGRALLTDVLGLVLPPFAIIGVVTVSIMTITYLKFGIFATTELSGSGYTSAYRSLLRIKQDNPIRFVSVTQEARLKGYAVSPSLNELRPWLDGKSNVWFWHTETRRWHGLAGEIADGWFYWALREAAARTNHHGSAPAADRFYQDIANEIDAAIAAGRLPTRPVLGSFLNPEFPRYLKHLPESLARVGRLLFLTDEFQKEREDPRLPPATRELFDRMAGRRSALLRPKMTTVQGWALSPDQPIQAVAVRDGSGRTVGQAKIAATRPDIIGSQLGAEVDTATTPGFVIEFPVEVPLDSASLVLQAAQDKEISVPLSRIVLGRVGRSKDSNGGLTLYALDAIVEPLLPKVLARSQSAIWQWHGTIILWLSVLAAVSLPLSWALHSRREPGCQEAIIATFLLFVVLSRVLLFSVLDMSSWNGAQPRYLLPIMPIYCCAMMLIISRTLELLRGSLENAFRRGRLLKRKGSG